MAGCRAELIAFNRGPMTSSIFPSNSSSTSGLEEVRESRFPVSEAEDSVPDCAPQACWQCIGALSL